MKLRYVKKANGWITRFSWTDFLYDWRARCAGLGILILCAIAYIIVVYELVGKR